MTVLTTILPFTTSKHGRSRRGSRIGIVNDRSSIEEQKEKKKKKNVLEPMVIKQGHGCLDAECLRCGISRMLGEFIF